MLIGHDRQERSFIDALARGRMPHAWLLAGPQGIGKAGFARRAAAYVIADGDLRAPQMTNGKGDSSLDVDPAHPAVPLIAHGTHPEYLWIKREIPEAKRPKDGGEGKAEDVARNITISQVRTLLTRLRLRPANARWRCVVIDSIDDLERNAANALLKTLEEPPNNTVFLLVSHQPGRLLPTIRSRCRLLRFSPLDDASMRQVISGFPGAIDPQEIDLLLAIAKGSPGRALQFAQADLSSIAAPLRAMVQSGDRDNRLRVELAKAIAGSGAAGRIEIMLVQANTILVDEALKRSGDGLVDALKARDRVAEIGRLAISGSEDPATLAFVVGGELCSLA